VWRTGDMHTGFWWGRSYGNNHLQDLDIEWRKMLKWVLKKWGGEEWIGLIWPEMVTGGGHL